MPEFPPAGNDELGILAQTPLIPGLPPFAGKFIPMQEARDLYRRVRLAPEGFRLEALLAEMKIEVEVQPADFERIPAKGPLVAVANHPFGVLDGAVLAALLSRARPDAQVLTNSLLAGIPELHRHCIFVDPFRTASSADKNLKSLKQAGDWLCSGHALAVFPAGEVSQLDLRQGEVTDPTWNSVAARLVRKTGASALPVYFCGRNSMAFQLLGLINPHLRTLFLLQEFLQQRGKRVQVRIGKPRCLRQMTQEPHRPQHGLTWLFCQAIRAVYDPSSLRRNAPATATSPVPSSPRVLGSGALRWL